MRFLQSLFVIGFAALFINCGISPKEACKEVAKVTCFKLVECTSDADKELLPYLKDTKSCEAELEKLGKCDNENPCESGKTYDKGAAEDCVIELNFLQCSDIDKGRISGKAPTCQKVCK